MALSVGDVPEVLALLPQAVLRVDRNLRIDWVEPAFASKTGLTAVPTQSLCDLLETTQGRAALAAAAASGERFSGEVTTCAMRQERVRLEPASNGAAWVLFEPTGLDDELCFARALQELGRALGEEVELDSLCAAGAAALVRCANAARAEVHLVEEGELIRVAGSEGAELDAPIDAEVLQSALSRGRPELGISSDALFAAIPLWARRHPIGLLVLFKARGASFSTRELDLWTAAAGQLAVAVDNARLLGEAQAALRVREEFMSIASHELKTPLTPLKMSLFIMERRLLAGQPVEMGSVVKSIKQVDRLAGLVNDLLDASRLELGKLAVARQPLELSQLVVEVLDVFRVAFERDFQLEAPGEHIWVMGDRDRLEQVLVNLLENAHKYSPQGVPVRVEIEAWRDGVELSVEDRGIGIPRTNQNQIFQRFYRAPNAIQSFGGLGLGLFISDSIVKLHGGALSLESQEGRGSRFTMRLRRMDPDQVRELLDEEEATAQLDAHALA
jgi:signal transduction histidine kinase